MMDQAFFRVQAANMARAQVQYLLKDPDRLSAETSLSQAVGIIRDSVRHLREPGLAIRLAIAFHPMAERWAAWAFWATALDLVLPLARDTEYIQLLLCRSQAARELGDYEVALAFATGNNHRQSRRIAARPTRTQQACLSSMLTRQMMFG